MARRLKVFQAQFGFFDTVVAAPSQAAALRAWGTRQNLFASGDARPATDEAAISAALEHPETPLQRAVGSTDPFKLEPTSLPEVPEAPTRATAKPVPSRRPPKPGRPPADRGQLDAAEAALQSVDEARKIEEAELRQRQDDLDRAKADAQASYVGRRKQATAAVVDARTAYRAAGGRD